MSSGGRGTTDEEILNAYRFSGKGVTDEEILAKHKFSGAGSFDTGGGSANMLGFKGNAKKTEFVAVADFKHTPGTGGKGYQPSIDFREDVPKKDFNVRVYWDLEKACQYSLGLEIGGIKNISIIKVEDHWEVRYA